MSVRINNGKATGVTLCMRTVTGYSCGHNRDDHYNSESHFSPSMDNVEIVDLVDNGLIAKRVRIVIRVENVERVNSVESVRTVTPTAVYRRCRATRKESDLNHIKSLTPEHGNQTGVQIPPVYSSEPVITESRVVRVVRDA